VTHLVSSVLHLLGAVAVVLATPSLLRRLGGGAQIQCAGVFHAFCVAGLLLASGTYHGARQLFGPEDPVTQVLVRVDHSAVWLILAGFFVLPHLIAQRGAWRWVPLVVVWTAAGLGIASKVLFFANQSAAEIVLPYALASLVGGGSTARFVSQRGVRASAVLLGFWAVIICAAACFVFRFPVLVAGWIEHHEVWHAGVLLAVYAHWRFVLQLAPEAPDAFPEGSGPILAMVPARIAGVLRRRIRD
jgi:hemolysin III